MGIKSGCWIVGVSARVRHAMLTLITCCALSIPLPSFALSSDRQELIHLEADSATLDENNGSSLYRGKGNVHVVQGTLNITADQIKILSKNKEVTQIIASTNKNSDKLVHFQQLPDGESELVTGIARQITYDVENARLDLIGQASLKQTESTSFSAETFSYDLGRGIVNMDSSDKQRVIMIVDPGK